MISEVECIRENKLSSNRDEFKSGFLSVNSDRRIVAYASLGDTDVAISRGSDGKIRVEIDDTSSEDVYVSINAQTVTVSDGVTSINKPWNA